MQYRNIGLPMRRRWNNKYFVTIDIAIKPSASETGWIQSGIIVGIMALDVVQIAPAALMFLIKIKLSLCQDMF